MDLYIYYRVATERAPQLAHTVTAMQAELSRRHQVASALKRRPEVKDGHHTWMEVYLDIPDDFTTHVAQAALKSGADTLIEGQRHAELFISESSTSGSSCA
ncbi:DUF4936 family protein [Glaciimonas immobilis]|uniref:DUF4936 family protein n=1 Tax=Glaciimonas immobilis TaxID=728004 RepID=A0A840RNX3_9BURK|nr:DUF4936 family protein [Glaciimonas immobilis]KAF3998943.1 DUF4936 family protein [Glaciimonas immobilis]MBB5198350.1 hypothetical protein [Glaciimonas immobilis]